MGLEQHQHDFEVSSLLRVRFSVPQDALPTTERALALDRQENLRRHKVYNNVNPYAAQYRKGTMGNARRFPSSSTAGQGDETVSGEIVQSKESAA